MKAVVRLVEALTAFAVVILLLAIVTGALLR